jgi:hypothetical protein
MTTRRAIFALLFLVLVSGLWSLSQMPLPMAYAQGSAGEYVVLQGNNLRFVGNIDGSLNIHMRLDVDGQRVVGSYYYDDIKTEIPLRGWIDGYQIRISEYDEQGKERAEFRGAIVAPGRFDGIWRRTESWRGSLYPVYLIAEGNAAGEVRPTATAESRAVWEGPWNRTVYTSAADTTVEIAFLTDKSFWFYLSGYSGGHSGWIRGMAFITPEGAVYKTGMGAELRFAVKNGLLTITANAEGKTLGGSATVEGLYARGERKMLLLKDIGVFESETQEERFRAMTGPYYEGFLSALHLGGKKEDLDGLGATVYGGFARGLAQHLRGIVMWTTDGRMWAAILTADKQGTGQASGNVVVYFTNDAGNRAKVPVTIQKWIDEVQAGREKPLEVIY